MPKKNKKKKQAAAETKVDNNAVAASLPPSAGVAAGAPSVAASPADAKTEAKILFGVPGKLLAVPVSQIEKSQNFKLNNELPPGEWAPEDKEAGEEAARQVKKNIPSIALCPTGKKSGLGGFFNKLSDGSMPQEGEFVAFYCGGDFIEMKEGTNLEVMRVQGPYQFYDHYTNTMIDLKKSGSIARFFNDGFFNSGAPDRTDFHYFKEGKEVPPEEVGTINLKAEPVGKKGGRSIVGLRLLRTPKEGEQATWSYGSPLPVMRKRLGYTAFHQTGSILEMRDRLIPVILKVTFPRDVYETLQPGKAFFTKCLLVETHSLQVALEEKEHNKPFSLEADKMYYLEECEDYVAEAKKMMKLLANRESEAARKGDEKGGAAVGDVPAREDGSLSLVGADGKEGGSVEDAPLTAENMPSVTASDEKATANTDFVTAECLVHLSHAEVRASLALHYDPKIAVGTFMLAYSKSEPDKIKLFPASYRAWEITSGYGDQPLSHQEEIRLQQLHTIREEVISKTNAIVLAGGIGKSSFYPRVREKLLKLIPEEELQVFEAFQALDGSLPYGVPLNQNLVAEIKELREKRAQITNKDFSRVAISANDHEEEHIKKLLAKRMVALSGFLFQNTLQLNTEEMVVRIDYSPTKDYFTLILKDESVVQKVVSGSRSEA